MCISVTVGGCSLVSHWIRLCPSSVLISKGIFKIRVLYVLWIYIPYHTCALKIFSPVLCFIFSSCFWCLMNRYFKFWWQWLLFFFLFLSMSLISCVRIHHQIQCHEDFPYTLCYSKVLLFIFYDYVFDSLNFACV